MKKYLLFFLLLLSTCKISFFNKDMDKKEFYGNKIKNDLIIESVFLCSREYKNINPELIISIIRAESFYNQKAINISNALYKTYAL